MRNSSILLILFFALVCVCKSQKLGTSLKNITETDKIKPKKKEDNPIKKDIKRYLRECGANVSDEDSDEGNNNNKNDGDEEEDEEDMNQQKTLSGMKRGTGSYPNTYGGRGANNKGTYPTSYGSGSKDEDDECEQEDSRENRGRRKNSKNNRRNKRSREKNNIKRRKFAFNEDEIENEKLAYGKFEKGKMKTKIVDKKSHQDNHVTKLKRIKPENDKRENIQQDKNQKIMLYKKYNKDLLYKRNNNKGLSRSLNFKDAFLTARNKEETFLRLLNLKDRTFANDDKRTKLKKDIQKQTLQEESASKEDLEEFEDEKNFTNTRSKIVHKRSNEENTKDVETFKLEDEDDFERYKNRNDKRRGGGKRKKNDDYDDDSDEDDDDDGCEDSGKNRRGGNRNNNRGKNNRNKNNNRGNKRGGYSFGGSGEDRYGVGNPYGDRYGGGYGGYGGEFGLYDGWGMYGGRLVKMMNATGIEGLVKRKRRDIEYDDARDPADVQCLSQCVFGYLEMLDDNRVPSETEVIKYLQNKISNSSLRIKTIREARRCFARLATTDTENGCQFSKSLAQCMKLEIEEKM